MKENGRVPMLTEAFSGALIIESPHPSLDEYLVELGIEPVRDDGVEGEQDLIDALTRTRAQLLFKRSRVPVTRRVIEASELFAIQLCCIGDDSVDKEACADHGVLVFHDPVSNGRSVVELAIGHLLSLSRGTYDYNDSAHHHQWTKTARERYEIKGKQLGVVGLGNIGRQVARAAENLGLEIAFFDNRPVAQEVGIEMGWRSKSRLHDLFASSDLVTVHTSAFDYYGRDNSGMLDEHLASLGAERPDDSPRIFVNLARGNLYAAPSLLEAVKAGRIRRAAVDVYPEEPATKAAAWTNPYAEESRIICTPHIGASTAEAQPRIARRVSRTIAGFSRYGSLRDCVFAPRFSLSVADEARGHAVLAVVHSTSRGTKKAIDETIYQAEVDNLGSSHRDFPNGIAYDVSILARPLTVPELENLVVDAARIANDPRAIRSVRQIVVPEQGWQ